MIAGVRGRLLTSSFIRDLLPSIEGPAGPSPLSTREIHHWSARTDAMLGPASSLRSIVDLSIVPLLRVLELDVMARADAEGCCVLQTACNGHRAPDVMVVEWSQSLSHAWRRGVLGAIASDNRWALCTNGTALRVTDAHRTWSREYLEFDLSLVGEEPECLQLLWRLLSGPSLAAGTPLLDRAVAMSARHGEDVCRALGAGAVDAVGHLVSALNGRRGARASTGGAGTVFQHSLTVLYRVLFLLFAEARGLVPVWHPVYRDRYSLDAIVSSLLAGRPYRGLWHAVQAISRLAHSGFVAGELKVNAFNGRLFAASESATFDRRPVADAVMAQAITAVSTRAVTSGRSRHRILYRDLDVEQLGAVYEHVLEYEPGPDTARAGPSREGRKASGTFYTPRAVTAFLVRSTLRPLVDGRTADEILRLRIVDPAMGSGAFLVAVCRFLAEAVEEALLREGAWHPGDVTPADRIALRRDIASRCLYGVDINPMAVQLARLSLWLTTLSADKPLSFLDHHLLAGDSLIGAQPHDVLRRPSKVPGRRTREDALPLFSAPELEPTLETAVRVRAALALSPDDTVGAVREKERALDSLSAHDTPLGRLSQLLDLWCAGWFWNGSPPDRAVFSALADRILGGHSSLPHTAAAPLLAQSIDIATDRRFLHWPVAFAEVFADERGRPTPHGGFDAVVGNPPWDMVRGDSGSDDVRASRRHDARQLSDFVRESGVYRVDTRTHVNRYQLFVERALQIVRQGGRIGLVLPSGFASDSGAAALRRHLLDRADVDSITGLDNRAAIFPIHRSVRFALVTCTAGRPTRSIACRFGISRTEDLERPAPRAPVVVSRTLLARLSGDDDLGVPELATERDLRVVERIHTNAPWLSSETGWNARFGRELNASDDRDAFRAHTGAADARPVVEGKQLNPFRVTLEACRLEMRTGTAAEARAASHPRLAYRDVASATNRLTLIAAIVPARAVTTHTLFCLKTPMPAPAQHVLCALLNSFVANYLVRLRVNTHVTVALVSRLPVPHPGREHPGFARLLQLARAIADSTSDVETMAEYAELQAIVAALYGLEPEEYDYILSTLPLIRPEVRSRSLALFLERRSR